MVNGQKARQGAESLGENARSGYISAIFIRPGLFMGIASRIRKTFPAAALLCAMPLSATAPKPLSSGAQPSFADAKTPTPAFIYAHPVLEARPIEKMATMQAEAIFNKPGINLDPKTSEQIIIDISIYGAVEQIGDDAAPGMMDACMNNQSLSFIVVDSSSGEDVYSFKMAIMDQGRLKTRLTGEASDHFKPESGYTGLAGLTPYQQCAVIIQSTLDAVRRSKNPNIARGILIPQHDGPR